MDQSEVESILLGNHALAKRIASIYPTRDRRTRLRENLERIVQGEAAVSELSDMLNGHMMSVLLLAICMLHNLEIYIDDTPTN